MAQTVVLKVRLERQPHRDAVLRVRQAYRCLAQVPHGRRMAAAVTGSTPVREEVPR